EITLRFRDIEFQDLETHVSSPYDLSSMLPKRGDRGNHSRAIGGATKGANPTHRDDRSEPAQLSPREQVVCGVCPRSQISRRPCEGRDPYRVISEMGGLLVTTFFAKPHSVVMGPRVRGDDTFIALATRPYFFTIAHSGFGGPKASSPEMVV